MFRSRPSLAIELLRDALHVEVPSSRVITRVEASLDELVPTEHRADLVLTLCDETDAPITGVVVVEVQLGRDADKQWTWPLYVAALRARYRCAVWLLVVAPFDDIAAWCATPLHFASGMGAMTPRVLGPGMIPWVTDESAAQRNPELALLSAVAHGGDARAMAILDALPAALAEMPRTVLPGYLAMLYDLLAPALRRRLEKIMTTRPFSEVPLPPAFQKVFDQWIEAGLERGLQQGIERGIQQGIERGIQQGIEEGRVEGLVEGRIEGLVEGRIESRASAILELLVLRGITVSDSVRSTVLACRDYPTLEHWFRRAATMKSAAAVVRSRPKP